MDGSMLPKAMGVAAVAVLIVGVAVTPNTQDAAPIRNWDDVAVPDARAKHNLLFIGNSLTFYHDLPGVLERLIEAGDAGPVHVESIAYPNFGLEDHWTRGTPREAIARGGWDMVILQQGPSATEGRPSLLEYSRRFAEEIAAKDGRVALYMVWPDRRRAFDFDGVRESYRMAAAQNDGLFLPAGAAWQVAWERDPDLALYGADGFHPSPMGTYLAALVMYQQLTGNSPVGLPPVLRTKTGTRIRIPRATATLLQECAAEANERHALPTDARDTTDDR